jgi:uncharacterized protein YjbI with pentapeptide repeats
MKKTFLITSSLLTSLLVTLPCLGENLSHLTQLLDTKECESCDLSHTGLAMANLTGVNLRGANLVNANLSRANLSGADLSYANLTGASLHGANLSGVNLTGAIINGADLRNAYLVNAIFSNTQLNNTQLQGAVGLSQEAASAEQFYLWGLAEDQQGNYQGALNNYNKAINIDSEFAPAYLGRAVINSRLGNTPKAIEYAERAGELFENQNNQEGLELSQKFVEFIQKREELEANEGGKGSPQFVQIINSVGPLLLKFILP